MTTDGSDSDEPRSPGLSLIGTHQQHTGCVMRAFCRLGGLGSGWFLSLMLPVSVKFAMMDCRNKVVLPGSIFLSLKCLFARVLSF